MSPRIRCAQNFTKISDILLQYVFLAYLRLKLHVPYYFPAFVELRVQIAPLGTYVLPVNSETAHMPLLQPLNLVHIDAQSL